MYIVKHGKAGLDRTLGRARNLSLKRIAVRPKFLGQVADRKHARIRLDKSGTQRVRLMRVLVPEAAKHHCCYRPQHRLAPHAVEIVVDVLTTGLGGGACCHPVERHRCDGGSDTGYGAILAGEQQDGDPERMRADRS